MEELEFMRTLGNNIRHFRGRAGLTQGQLAEKIGRSLASVSKYERGDCAIDTYSLCRIAEALNISANQLIPEPKPQTVPDAIDHSWDMMSQNKVFYLYNYGFISGKLCCNMLEIDWVKNEVVMYVDTNGEQKNDYRLCGNILYGRVISTSACISIWVENPIAQIDYFHIVINGADWVAGKRVCHVSYSTLNWRVVSGKGIFTANRTKPDNWKELLTFSKQELQDIKKRNQVLF